MSKLKAYFTDVEWYVAIRKHDKKPIKEHEVIDVKVLKNSWRYWCADPFLFDKNNTTYIFMEVYDKIKQQGYIGYRILEDNGTVSPIRVCLKTRFHMSYPFIFEKNGNIYIMPECYQSNKLSVYKAVDFPNKWVEEHVVLNDIPVCDSNIIEKDGQRYLMTMKVYGMPFQYDKLFLYIEKDGKWELACEHPVVTGAKTARNGGAFFFDSGSWIRPAQNCENTYGESLSFKRVTKLNPVEYREDEIAQLWVNRVKVENSKKKFDGIHTYNTNGEYDVIDLRIEHSFQFAHFFALIEVKLKSVFGRKK